MSDKELRELDAWIAEHVMQRKPWKVGMAFNADETGVVLVEGKLIGRKDVERYCQDYPQYHFKVVDQYPSYTTDCDDAMMVLEKCAKELHEQDNEETVSIGMDTPYYVVEKTNNLKSLRVEAATLPLAICLFAKQLFEGKEKV